MRHATDTLPELGVLVHDAIMSTEKWYGFLLEPTQDHAQKVARELNTIFRRYSKHSRRVLPLCQEGQILYARGPYPEALVSEIENYLSQHKQYFAKEPIIAHGTEDDILGPNWMRITQNSRYKH